MPLFHSCEPTLHEHSSTVKRLHRTARRAIQRVKAGFKVVHRAIIAAKTRKIERELMFHKVPQRPLILDDRWDF